jgi:hypothetical protein
MQDDDDDNSEDEMLAMYTQLKKKLAKTALKMNQTTDRQEQKKLQRHIQKLFAALDQFKEWKLEKSNQKKKPKASSSVEKKEATSSKAKEESSKRKLKEESSSVKESSVEEKRANAGGKRGVARRKGRRPSKAKEESFKRKLKEESSSVKESSVDENRTYAGDKREVVRQKENPLHSSKKEEVEDDDDSDISVSNKESLAEEKRTNAGDKRGVVRQEETPEHSSKKEEDSDDDDSDISISDKESSTEEKRTNAGDKRGVARQKETPEHASKKEEEGEDSDDDESDISISDKESLAEEKRTNVCEKRGVVRQKETPEHSSTKEDEEEDSDDDDNFDDETDISISDVEEEKEDESDRSSANDNVQSSPIADPAEKEIAIIDESDDDNNDEANGSVQSSVQSVQSSVQSSAYLFQLSVKSSVQSPVQSRTTSINDDDAPTNKAAAFDDSTGKAAVKQQLPNDDDLDNQLGSVEAELLLFLSSPSSTTIKGGAREKIGDEATITTTGFQSISKTILSPSKANGTNQQRLSPVQQPESVEHQEVSLAKIRDLDHRELDDDAARVPVAMDDDQETTSPSQREEAETLEEDNIEDHPEQSLQESSVSQSDHDQGEFKTHGVAGLRTSSHHDDPPTMDTDEMESSSSGESSDSDLESGFDDGYGESVADAREKPSVAQWDDDQDEFKTRGDAGLRSPSHQELEEEEQGQDGGTTENKTQQKEEMLSSLSTEKKRQPELMKEMLIEIDVDPDEMERLKEVDQHRVVKEQQPKEKQDTKLRSNGEDHDVEPKATDFGVPTEAAMIEPAMIEHREVTTKPMKDLTPSPTSEKEPKIVEESSTKAREIPVNAPNNKEEDSKASTVAVHPSDRRPLSKAAAVRDAKRARILANMHRLDETMEQARRVIR